MLLTPSEHEKKGENAGHLLFFFLCLLFCMSSIPFQQASHPSIHHLWCQCQLPQWWISKFIREDDEHLNLIKVRCDVSALCVYVLWMHEHEWLCWRTKHRAKRITMKQWMNERELRRLTMARSVLYYMSTYATLLNGKSWLSVHAVIVACSNELISLSSSSSAYK